LLLFLFGFSALLKLARSEGFIHKEKFNGNMAKVLAYQVQEE